MPVHRLARLRPIRVSPTSLPLTATRARVRPYWSIMRLVLGSPRVICISWPSSNRFKAALASRPRVSSLSHLALLISGVSMLAMRILLPVEPDRVAVNHIELLPIGETCACAFHRFGGKRQNRNNTSPIPGRAESSGGRASATTSKDEISASSNPLEAWSIRLVLLLACRSFPALFLDGPILAPAQ